MEKELPPFSLEEAKEWLHRLEDIASIERDMGFATRLVLINLIRQLTESGVFSGQRLIDLIQRNLDQIPEGNYRFGTEQLLDDLQQALSPAVPPGVLWH